MLNLSKWIIIIICILTGLAIGVASFFLALKFFLIIVPDCAPNQIDGQCGLATFLDMIAAFSVSVGIWLVSSIFLAWYWLRKKRKASNPSTITTKQSSSCSVRES